MAASFDSHRNDSRSVRTIQSDSPLLEILMRVLHPAAEAEDRLLGEAIRTLVKYALYRPIDTSDHDLEVMLAVSAALARSAHS